MAHCIGRDNHRGMYSDHHKIGCILVGAMAQKNTNRNHYHNCQWLSCAVFNADVRLSMAFITVLCFGSVRISLLFAVDYRSKTYYVRW